MSEAARTFCQTCHPGGELDRVSCLGLEQPAVRGRAERLDVRAEEFDELGRDRNLADGLEAEGFDCVLADAKQVKNLPGRPKRDPADPRWLTAGQPRPGRAPTA